MQIAALHRQIENLIRIGTVIAVNPNAPLCRVKSGDLETDWLRTPSLRAGSTRKWSPLTLGEQVMVISPSGVIEGGFVMPLGIFSDSITPPSTSPDIEMTEYPDGAVMSYNHNTSALSITGINMLNITASGDVMISNDGDAVLNCQGKATVRAAEIELFDGVNACSGIVTQTCLCAYTNAPHPQGSSTVKASA